MFRYFNIVYPNGVVVQFGYNGLGRRVFRQEGSNVRYFYYDGDRIIAEREGSSWVVRYLLGLKPCGHVVSGQVRVYHADRLGSVRWVTDGSGNLVASYVYEGFGKIVGQDGNEVVPYRFCGLWGYRNDGDAGLLHVGARYYEVETGRWVQKDPMIAKNLYSYVDNNPIIFVDPTGSRGQWKDIGSGWEIRYDPVGHPGGPHVDIRGPGVPKVRLFPNQPPPKGVPKWVIEEAQKLLSRKLLKSAGCVAIEFLIILCGVEACYEIATYQPGGPPTGLFTAIGDWFTKTQAGEWLTDQLAKILPP